jgi:hypothetical protein
MTTALSYLRLILFLGGVLVGIQIPGFVDQYGKSLEAHLQESKINLTEFKQDADRYFGGDMKKLIVHYQQDGDPVFQGGGDSINSIYRRNVVLKDAAAGFEKSGFSAYIQTFVNPVPDIREEVWNNYTYSIKLDLSAISTGLLAGLILAVLVEFFLRGLIGFAGLLAGNLRPSPKHG